MTLGQALFGAFALYAAAGLLTGTAFVAAGLTKVLPDPSTFTLGARLVLLPASIALWPYVLVRWFKVRGTR